MGFGHSRGRGQLLQFTFKFDGAGTWSSVVQASADFLSTENPEANFSIPKDNV